jgi:hypothetical protein
VWHIRITLGRVKAVTFRLPPALIADIDREARARRVSKSDVVRDRLSAGRPEGRIDEIQFGGIADLVGSVDRLAPDVSANRKQRLKSTGYGRKRPR